MTENKFDISFNYLGKKYEGQIIPLLNDSRHSTQSFYVVLNTVEFGYVKRQNRRWLSDTTSPKEMINIIGECIYDRIED